MKHWKKAAALCIVLFMICSAAVFADDAGQEADTAAAVAAGTEEAGKTAEDAADTADIAGTAGTAEETAADLADTADTTADLADTADTAAAVEEEKKAIDFWTDDSPAMASIISYVESVKDEDSEYYVPETERVAVFDMDGTLYGELFPTYFDQSLLMYRLLYDKDYEAAPEDKEFAQALEDALIKGEEEPDSPRSTAQMAAESFKGYTVEEYREYVRAFMSQPVNGFEGMTYGEGFYEPMAALVQYLDENGFKVYICSGAERSLVRELTEDKLGEWIPPYQVIGSTFSLTASGQGDTAGRDYTYAPDDKVLMEGNMTDKNLKMNKVINIVDEIGVIPVLAFGNSSGDFAMAQYIVQNGGKAYMLLCDDTERDYGNTEKAASFAEKCKERGFETVSMKNEFETIYGAGVQKTSYQYREAEEESDILEDKEPEDAAQAGTSQEEAAQASTTQEDAAQAGTSQEEAAQASTTQEDAAQTAATQEDAAQDGSTAPQEEEEMRPAA